MTTEAAHTPAWGKVFLNSQEAFQLHKFQVTVFRVVTYYSGRKACSGRSASRIPTGESSGMKRGRKFRRTRFSAEHMGARTSHAYRIATVPALILLMFSA